MEKYEIDKLIEKYFDATSTLEEEQKLSLDYSPSIMQKVS